MKKARVAIIGSGISGLAAAYFLNEKYDVKLFEKENYLGGNSRTVEIDYDGKTLLVDPSLTAFNQDSHPNFVSLLKNLSVATSSRKISFAVKSINDLEYCPSSFLGCFASIENLKNSELWQMLFEIRRFNKNAHELLNQPFDVHYSIAKFLKDSAFGKMFCELYLLPLAAIIWKVPISQVVNYPAANLIRFLDENDLLHNFHQPRYLTFRRNISELVIKFTARIGKEKISLSNSVIRVLKNERNHLFIESENSVEEFDRVIFAIRSDQALKIIENPSKKQSEILGKIKFHKDLVILHKDQNFMPKAKLVWASRVFGYNKNENSAISASYLTYFINSFQNIDEDYPVFLSYGCENKINPYDIFDSFEKTSTIFDEETLNSQKSIEQMQGESGIYFCGSYLNQGTFEDAVVSASKVANMLNCA